MTALSPEPAIAKAAPTEIPAPDTGVEEIFPAHTAPVFIELAAQVKPPLVLHRVANETALVVEQIHGLQLVSSID